MTIFIRTSVIEKLLKNNVQISILKKSHKNVSKSAMAKF